jgi:hypothetical protein
MGTRSWIAFAICSAAVELAGCCSSPDGARSLVDHDKWTVLSDSEDPYISRKPDEVMCTPESVISELFNDEPSLTVLSSGCSYVTLAQPCASSACAGENFHIRLWHYQLTNPEPAQAYVAIALAGETIWEDTIDIPSSSGLLIPYIPLDEDLAEGAQIAFHLQNHGVNTWNLIEVSVGADPP